MAENLESTGIKSQMNAVQRQIEGVKLQRLGVKLQIEQEGLKADQINLQKAKVSVAIAGEGLRQEEIKLGTAKINTQVALVGQYSAQQALNTAQTGLLLQRQQDQATLQLKAIKVAELREQVNQQVFLNGNASVPQLGGSQR